MSAPRRLEYVALSDIKRARRNPKRHDATEIEASLTRFGVGELPLIDQRTGLLVAGEGRVNQLDAMYAADPAKPPGGVQIAPGDWLVPVITGWASADDAEADAYLIMSNRLSERGGWDGLDLSDMLHGLADLTGVGYSQAELDDLFATTGYLDAAAAMLDELAAVAVPDFADPEPEPDRDPAPQRGPLTPPPPTPARPALDPFSPTGTPQAAPPPQSAPAPQHSPALPAQASPAAGGTEPQWFQINWTATHAQRESIHEAIRLARDRFKATSSVAALAAVCQAYVDSVAA